MRTFLKILFQVFVAVRDMYVYLYSENIYSNNCSFVAQVFTTRRLDTFRAMASPAYIALTEEDPIMAAFSLSQKFRSLSEIEGEYKVILLTTGRLQDGHPLRTLNFKTTTQQCNRISLSKTIFNTASKTLNLKLTFISTLSLAII